MQPPPRLVAPNLRLKAELPSVDATLTLPIRTNTFLPIARRSVAMKRALVEERMI
jgi:hypothetical protein